MTNSTKEFNHGFGDFETLFHDVDLNNWVIRSYGVDDEGFASYYMIRGYTELQNDILLHCIEVSDCVTFEEAEKQQKAYGLHFIPLSKFVGNDGFDIYPMDQFFPCDGHNEDEDEQTNLSEKNKFGITQEEIDALLNICTEPIITKIPKAAFYQLDENGFNILKKI